MALVPYDDRDGWIWLDGAFTPWRDAKIHVLTHALHYASAVFEGERMYGGEIFRLAEHTRRLFRSAEILDYEIPYTVAEIEAACKETCARNGLEDCYIRPIAWRGSEVMGVSAQASKVHVAIAVWEWPSYFDPVQKAKGIALTWAKYRRPAPDTAPAFRGSGRDRRPGPSARTWGLPSWLTAIRSGHCRPYHIQRVLVDRFFLQQARGQEPPAAPHGVVDANADRLCIYPLGKRLLR